MRTGEAVREIKELLKANGGEKISVIAKVEDAGGLKNIDEVVCNLPELWWPEETLGWGSRGRKCLMCRKTIIQKCNSQYKPVITATQMLDSMIRNPRPTRAEVTDVANAIYDGTDAIMLSGETAMGKYPVEALQMMVSIAEPTEPYLDYKEYIDGYNSLVGNANVASAVGKAAVETAINIKAACIITPTVSGQARLISNFRPKMPIYAVSPNNWALTERCSFTGG